MISENDTSKNPTRDLYLRIWENERKTRDFAVKLMWENIKFFGGFIGSLLTAYIGIVGLIATSKITILYTYYFAIFFPVPVFVIVLALYARKDLKQRQKNFFLVVTHLLKLEQLLGLHEKINDKLPYLKNENEQYLFSEYHEKLDEYKNLLSQGKSTKDFQNEQVKFNWKTTFRWKNRKTNAFNSMRQMYSWFIGIALALIAFGIIVLINPCLIQLCKP